MDCIFCRPLGKDIIYESRHWRVFPAYSQVYLGRCIIPLKRHCGEIFQLSRDEWEDFADLSKKVEGGIKKAFEARMFNWSCLMNDAYRNSPPNPHMHWHVRPRYDHTVEFSGLVFEDAEFGHHYNREREIETPEEIRERIAQRIKESIHRL